MKRWLRALPPYEGAEPYLYLAFAEADCARIRRILTTLRQRGCRVWYCLGPAGGAAELLRRQQRAEGAGLTLVYLTDAACADRDTKGFVMVNQKKGRPILCLDPDGADRRLAMDLREDVPHLALSRLSGSGALEDALIHAEGFSQEMIGEPARPDRSLGRWSLLFCALALLLSLACFALPRFLAPPTDSLELRDPVLREAVLRALGRGPLTEERVSGIRVLELEALPESWEELRLLPGLEVIELPQQALTSGAVLPEGDYVIRLEGGAP